MSDMGTQHYINVERERCAALVKMLINEPEFLVYCIRAPVYPTENIADHRRRFGEFTPTDDFEGLTPVPDEDDFEDLM
jgi:hypothetical protein